MKRFESVYLTSDDDTLDKRFFDTRFRDLDNRLHAVEELRATFAAASEELVRAGQERIDNVLLPALERVDAYRTGGFLTAPILANSEIPFELGTITFAIHADYKDLFRPTPFVMMMRDANVTDWALGQALAYNEQIGELTVDVIQVHGNEGPFEDVKVTATAGAAVSMIQFLERAEAAAETAESAITLFEEAETLAATVAGHASTSSSAAGAAASSAALAADWASKAEDSVVSGGLFSARHYAIKAAASAASIDPATIIPDVQVVNTDANFTLTPGVSKKIQKHTGTLTANRTITFSPTSADLTTFWIISRTGGDFALLLGTGGALGSLGYGEWAEVRWDGSDYYVARRGRTDMTVAFSGAADPTPTAFGFSQIKTGDMSLAIGDGGGNTRRVLPVPSAFAAGDLLYGLSPTELGRVAKSTARRALVMDSAGDAPEWSDRATCVLMPAQLTTSGTTKDFTGIPDWAKRIDISFDRVSLSGTDRLLVQIGDAGGIETTGYSSACARSDSGFDNRTDSFPIQTSNAANVMSGVMTLMRVSGNTWVSSHVIAAPGTGVSQGAGTKTLSDVLTQVRILTSGSNNFDAGEVSVTYFG